MVVVAVTMLKIVEPTPPTIGFALGVAVAPPGKPVTLTATLLLKLPRAELVTVKFPLPPATIVCELGNTFKEKSATFRFTIWFRRIPAIVGVLLSPPTVMGKLPVGVVELVVTVIVDEPAPIMFGGLKLTVAPGGCPIADS